jgi:twitching motility protein PilT
MAGTIALTDKVYAASSGRDMSMFDLLALFRREGSARATDLHLKAGHPPCYRVDGDLKITGARPIDDATMAKLTHALVDDVQWRTLEKQRSVNASLVVDGMRYRVNAYHDLHGLGLALRALDTALPTLEFVGFPNNVWEDIVNLTQGLVLVTGSTGMGKSTTIAALINAITARRSCHIITLEDPIEYEFQSDNSIITQRAIGRDVPNYERGLRDSLREDPDVIFVGEMTDPESAMWTLAAAETGHVVFSGIHARNAVGTVTRILDMFPSERHEEISNQLALGLRYIISQKLVQREGQFGRMAVMEILNNTFSAANCIRHGRLDQLYSLMQTNTRDVPRQRMTTMERSLVTLVRAGKIPEVHAERAANNPAVFEEEMKRQV